jgi:diadenosine tetraphosphate (Ap4A) HIT family hydrolase
VDFRGEKDFYELRDESCALCQAASSRKLLASNQLAVAFGDKFEVSRGHCLVIPKRHVEKYSDLTVGEIQQMSFLVKEAQLILAKDRSVQGFNIGINDGEVAGQTIPHVHMHIIPRRAGDHPDPRGGIRNILGKTSY